MNDSKFGTKRHVCIYSEGIRFVENIQMHNRKSNSKIYFFRAKYLNLTTCGNLIRYIQCSQYGSGDDRIFLKVSNLASTCRAIAQMNGLVPADEDSSIFA